jgi:uncharacterized protein YndB with AHSA1/START domain
MRKIVVRRTFAAPVEDVFDVYTDHASWAGVAGIRSAVVTRPGDVEPNGLGAVREVSTSVTFFREEITHFERPRRMDYRILESRPRMDHELGRVDFSETDAGTLVVWTSIFTLRTPLVGRLTEGAAAAVGSHAFRRILAHVDRATTPT